MSDLIMGLAALFIVLRHRRRHMSHWGKAVEEEAMEADKAASKKLIVGRRYKLREDGEIGRLLAIDLWGMAHIKFPMDRDELQIKASILAANAIEVKE